MKQLKFYIGLFTIAAVVASCSTSDKVASHHKVQKRKYNKGLYIAKHQSAEKVSAIEATQIAAPMAVVETPVNTVEAAAVSTPEVALEASTAIVPIVEQQSFQESITATAPVKVAVPAAEVEELGIKVQQKLEKKAAKLERKLTKKVARAEGEGKSQLVALILAFAAGGLGIHRFYLGYTGIGIAQIFTLGGCGVWSLIDLIRIAIGDLGPKDGEYAKTL